MISPILATVVNCYVGCNTGAPDGQTMHVLECDTDSGAISIVQTVKDYQGTTYFAFDKSADGGLRRRCSGGICLLYSS